MLPFFRNIYFSYPGQYFLVYFRSLTKQEITLTMKLENKYQDCWSFIQLVCFVSISVDASRVNPITKDSKGKFYFKRN